MIHGDMNDTIEAAKAEFLRAKSRVATGLKTTPDDKINWSPSPTARTAVQQVAHVAISIKGMMDWLKGVPFPYADFAEMDTAARAMEKEYTSRDQVLQLLDENSDAYLGWLDSLTPEFLATTLETPFGSFPMSNAITFPADHTRGHAAQLEYIQTIYGDLGWHSE